MTNTNPHPHQQIHDTLYTMLNDYLNETKCIWSREDSGIYIAYPGRTLEEIQKDIFESWTKYSLTDCKELTKLPKEEFERMKKLARIYSLEQEIHTLKLSVQNDNNGTTGKNLGVGK